MAPWDGCVWGALGCRFEPWPARQDKDSMLLQLWLRLQLQPRSDPWPGNSTCSGAAEKGKTNLKRKANKRWQSSKAAVFRRNRM